MCSLGRPAGFSNTRYYRRGAVRLRARAIEYNSTPMSRDSYGEHGQCEATNRHGERCGQPASGEHGKCYWHGGNTPTKEENESVGAAENNQNAVGNDGGAPEGNQNRMKTGVGSDPADLFAYLKDNDPPAAAWIMDKLAAYADEVPFTVFVIDVTEYDVTDVDELEAGLTAKGNDLLYECVKDYARWQGVRRQFEEGLVTEQTVATDAGKYVVEDANPINLELDRIDRTTMKAKKDLKVFGTDADSIADAVESGFSVFARAMEDQRGD